MVAPNRRSWCERTFDPARRSAAVPNRYAHATPRAVARFARR